jgi:hypothetical protein
MQTGQQGSVDVAVDDTLDLESGGGNGIDDVLELSADQVSDIGLLLPRPVNLVGLSGIVSRT